MGHFLTAAAPVLAALLVACAPTRGAAGRPDEPALLNVTALNPNIRVEMRYASTDNFTGRTLYPAAECLLCEPAAHRLDRVQRKLEKRGLGLKVWDCYRPISVQRKLWEVVPDPRYVADPKTGSRHNRGASVDLTLVDRDGNELEMPTAFDDFSERAHRNFNDLPAAALKNREILREAMESEGFIGLPTEWWHFDDPEWSHFALRDEPLGSPSLKADRPAAAQARLVPAATRQLVTVISDDWSSATAPLQRYERSADGWAKVGAPWDVSLGKAGLRWGRGLQPDDMAGPKKKEGDLAAPAGLFRIGEAHGYAERAPAGTRWPYSMLTEKSVCVDDPASKRYNEIFESDPANRDWSSAETMRRGDHLYKWLVNVEQNTPTECGCGSCIFLHIWRRPGAHTEGCTAMEETNLLSLIGWLDPSARPMLVQLPAAEYNRLRDAWDLP